MKMNGFVPASHKRLGGQATDRFTDLDALVELSEMRALLCVDGDYVFFQLVQRPRPLVKDVDEALYQGHIVAALKCIIVSMAFASGSFDKLRKTHQYVIQNYLCQRDVNETAARQNEV